MWWKIVRKVFFDVLTGDPRPSTPESPEFWASILPVGDTTWAPPYDQLRYSEYGIREEADGSLTVPLGESGGSI